MIDLQHAIGAWHRQHFPHAQPTRLVLKLCEEAGELAKAHNRRLAVFTPTWDDCISPAEADGVGDVGIVLIALCDRADVDFETLVRSVFAGVAARSSHRVHYGEHSAAMASPSEPSDAQQQPPTPANGRERS